MGVRWGSLVAAPLVLGLMWPSVAEAHARELLTVALSATEVAPGQAVVMTATLTGSTAPVQYVFWVRGPHQGWRRYAAAKGSDQASVTESQSGLYWVRAEAISSSPVKGHGQGQNQNRGQQNKGQGRGNQGKGRENKGRGRNWGQGGPRGRGQGKGEGPHVIFSRPTLFDVGGGIQLTVSSASIPSGGTVTLRAHALGLPRPLYQFAYETPAGQWVTVGGWSPIAHTSLTLTSPGAYEGRVDVKTANGLSLESETVDWSVYGAPAALDIVPSKTVWVADGAETEVLTVEAVDAEGDVVSNFSGSGTIQDVGAHGAISAWGATSATLAPVSSSPAEPLTFLHGEATIDVQAGTTVASDALTATAAVSSGATISGTLTLSAVSPVATAVQVTPESTALIANESGNPATFDVAVDDQAGEPMLSGTYALDATLEGPAQFQTLTAGPVPVTYVGGEGAVPVTVYSVAGESGPVTLTVSGTGLTAGSATVSAIYGGQPYQMGVSAASTTLTDGASTTLTLSQLTRTGGAVDPASVDNSGYVITITAAGGGEATGFTLDGAPYAGVPMTIAVATGANGFYATSQPVTLAVTDAAPGTYDIVVSDADGLLKPSATLAIQVASPPAP